MDTSGAHTLVIEGAVGFINRYGDLDSWLALPVQERRDTRSDVMAFAGHALVHCHVPIDPVFVVSSGCRWGKYTPRTPRS